MVNAEVQIDYLKARSGKRHPLQEKRRTRSRTNFVCLLRTPLWAEDVDTRRSTTGYYSEMRMNGFFAFGPPSE
jgi:hypothetical protein